MNRTFAVVGSVLALSLSVIAQDARQASVTLKSAQAAETIEQDLPKAITLYERALKEAGSDRVLVPQILLPLAQAYSKTGRVGDGQTAYERIVQEWPNSSEATTARTRLREISASAAARPGQGASTPASPRPLWTLAAGDWVTGRVSADGRWIAYYNYSDGPDQGLTIRDLATGKDRIVARPSPGESDFFVPDSAFSRDGKKLAYRASFNAKTPTSQLRVIDLGEPGLPTPRVLIDTGDRGRGMKPEAWTRDGRSILVIENKNATTWNVALVSNTDGVLQILKTITSNQRPDAALSPDGSQCAISLPEDAAGGDGIALVQVDTLRETRVADPTGRTSIVGWTPDGKNLLFTSTRSGSLALWSQRVEGGRTLGEAELILRDFGDFGPGGWSLGLTSSGALYTVVAEPQETSVMGAEFDFSSGTFISAPRNLAETFVRSNVEPRWSLDGTRVGFFSNRGANGPLFVSRAASGGQSHEARFDFTFGATSQWTWASDSASIMAFGAPGRERIRDSVRVGIHRLDISTGQVSPIVLTPGRFPDAAWSPDGRFLFYTRLPSPASQPVRVQRDLATGAETMIGLDTTRPVSMGSRTYEGKPISGGTVIVERDGETGVEREFLRVFPRSPDWRLAKDARAIVAVTTDLATQDTIVVARSIDDASVKVLFRAVRGQQLSVPLVSPDGRSVVLRHSPGGTQPSSFWWVPLDGRERRQLDELTGTNLNGRFEVHPNGRSLAFQVRNKPRSSLQVFVIENFLPAGARRVR